MRRLLGALLLLTGLAWAEGSPLDADPLRNIREGGKFPAFSLKDSAGGTHGLGDAAGRPALFVYFRSGQPFSEQVLAELKDLEGAYGKEVAFIGVRHPSPEEAPLSSAVPPLVLLDEKRELYGALGLFVLPTVIVVDREQRVAAAWGGISDGLRDRVAGMLDRTLGRPVKAATPPAPSVGPVEDPRAVMARKLLADGRPKDALAAVEPLLASSPTCGALLISGEASLVLGRAVEAKSRAESCLTLEPASSGAALLLGGALSQAGDPAEAEQWLKKAEVMNPGSQRARFLLGQLYEKAGRKDEALHEYRIALEKLLR